MHNGSHVAVLIPALAAGRDDLVHAALNDRLHEPYRKALIDGFDDVKKIAEDAGAVAFFLSGSGSTL
ncbi:MAG: homoserine kinase, partial [Clostridia bacterium]|nr:homoserine kinase [Clostridia bacterium]